jgi:hypothetical protein
MPPSISTWVTTRRVSSVQTSSVFFFSHWSTDHTTGGLCILGWKQEHFTCGVLWREQQSGHACVECLRSNLNLPQTSARLQTYKMCVYMWLFWLVRRYQREALHRMSNQYVLKRSYHNLCIRGTVKKKALHWNLWFGSVFTRACHWFLMKPLQNWRLCFNILSSEPVFQVLHSLQVCLPKACKYLSLPYVLHVHDLINLFILDKGYKPLSLTLHCFLLPAITYFLLDPIYSCLFNKILSLMYALSQTYWACVIIEVAIEVRCCLTVFSC